MLRFSGNLVLCLVALLPVVCSEILPFSLLLEPVVRVICCRSISLVQSLFINHPYDRFLTWTRQSEYIHYVEGYLVAPGYIDLSRLRFLSVNTGDFVVDDTAFDEGGRDDDGNRALNQDFGMEGSALDIAVFHLVGEQR